MVGAKARTCARNDDTGHKEDVLESAEFGELWHRISRRTSYRLAFDTEVVVADAIRRIDEMPPVERAKFHLSKSDVTIGAAGVGGQGGIDLGTVESEAAISVPDVVRDLCRRLPLSRATIVRILKGCSRVDDVKANPAVFIDQVADCMSRALWGELSETIEYTPSGESWEPAMFRDRHQDETIAPRVVPVDRSVVDMVVCDSEVEEKFALYLDGRDDVPLFIKLPEWYKIPTPLGNYNPDWALVRDREGDRRYYLVRETKGGSDIEKLRWESEGWKIRCGEAHYDAIDVDYAFGHDPVKLIEPSGLAPVVPIRALRLVADVDPADRFETYLPVYSLQAAAGYFGEGHDVEVEGWAEVPVDVVRIDDSMFVSQVVGRSMEPLIPDASYCVFRRIRAGSRQGKVVLAQHHSIDDVETGGSYTVKRYESRKEESDGEFVGSIKLCPVNPEFEPIVLDPGDDAEVQVIAELVTVLGEPGA